MNNSPFYTRLILTYILFILISSVSSQVNVVNENFSSTTYGQAPTGWDVNVINGFQFRCDTTNLSSGYSSSSGGKNILIRNSDNTGLYQITTPPINMNGLSNISIIWGSRVSVNFTGSGSTVPQLSYSTDGVNWNNLPYQDNEANSIWNLVNNSIPLSLPPAVNNATSLQFKWEVSIVNSNNGTYRMDDIQVSGLSPLMIPVTLKVDMNQELINPTGVHLQGNFQGWNPSSLNMINEGNNIYSYTGAFNIGDTLYYRFINGSLNSLAESISGSCSASYNNVTSRRLIVGNPIDTVCFSSCDACVPPVYTIFGCTNNLACNYNAAANADDGTCLVVGANCNDGSSITVNDVVNSECWCQGTLVGGACSELFISEYVEGLGNNKAIEIYNPTNIPVDLSNYGLVRYNNGSATPGDISYLSGATVGAHDVYVVVLDKRDPLGTGLEAPIFPELEALADTFINPLSSGGVWPMYFSGNDPVALVKDNGLTQVDLFGKTGETPGFGGWNAYGTSIIGTTLYISENHTLKRKNYITNGVVSNPMTFDVLLEYDSLPNNTFSGLGFHDCQCNVVAIPGCISPNACNYNPVANQSDGTCLFPNTPCDDQNPSTINDLTDLNCNCVGTLYILGCTNSSACNFAANANVDDGSCLFVNQSCNDLNNNTMNDLVDANCQCQGIPIIEGCDNPIACNYNINANVNDGSCFSIGDICNDGNPNTINDFVDLNCLCNGTNYLPGCTDLNACNYNPLATSDNGTCLIVGSSCNDNNSNTINDSINIGCVCEGEMIVLGCTIVNACNFNPNANSDNGTCLIVGSNCNDNNSQTINDVILPDCSCQGSFFILGCTSSSACNYNSLATNDDGSCLTIDEPCDDFNSSTINDVIDTNCECHGLIPPGCPQMTITANIVSATCAGDQTASIEINVNTPFSPCTILWENGSSSTLIDSLSVGWYNVSITDSTNCTEVDSFYVSPASLNPIEIITDTIIHNNCFGYSEGAISIHATGGTGLYYLTWDTNPIQTAINITQLAAGIYTAHVEDTNGCYSDEVFEILEPSGQFPQISGVDSTANLTSTAYTVNFDSSYTYEWSVTGGVITNNTDSSATVQWGNNILGQINVTQIDSSGCTLSQSIYVQVGTSIEEEFKNLSIYPNPVSEILFVSNTQNGFIYAIYDQYGRLIDSNSLTSSIAIKGFSSGVYTLVITSQEKQLALKFIKI